jgi:hypothetical protein
LVFLVIGRSAALGFKVYTISMRASWRVSLPLSELFDLALEIKTTLFI